MSHHFRSESYRLADVKQFPDSGRAVGRWMIFHNNESSPNSPITICLCAVDGKELKPDDPRRTEIQLPFGLLAEFVGFRVLRDKAYDLEDQPSRQALGLRDQGGYAVQD